MYREYLEELISKFYSRSLSDSEKSDFEHLLNTSEEARKLFHTSNMINQALDAFSIQQLCQETPLPKKHLSFNKIRIQIRNIAAVLTIPLLIGIVVLLIEKNKDDIPVYNEVACTKGKVTQVYLSDGTKVHLYTGSKLIYPAIFKYNHREVKLIGEATFEVVSDKRKPFYVEIVDGSKVKAYGTKFTICAYDSDSLTSVFLERGAVDFESPDLRSPVVIKPGKRIDYQRNRKTYRILQETSDAYNAKEEGILLFRKTPLTEIISKLSKTYETEIVIDNSKLGDYLFTAVFKDESLSQIMDMLKKSSPDLNWRVENNVIILY